MEKLDEKVFYEIIEKEKIKTVFQPIVSLENGKIMAYEACGWTCNS